MKPFLRCLILVGVLAALAVSAQARPLRQVLTGRAAQATMEDVAYGPDERQKMDIYRPPIHPARGIIVMVHGGAWKIGDKAHGRVKDNKALYFTQQQGSIFISINYRLVPDVTPDAQLQDVFAALRAVQNRAPEWGVDPAHIVLMGHSAGAHLVALASANGQAIAQAGVQPWRGTVVLDSAAMDVPDVMQARHMGFYDDVFGSNPAVWRALSPLHQLGEGGRTMLLVCSTRRAQACAQARSFAQAAAPIGVKVGLLPQDMSHGEINDALGLPTLYTQTVQQFIDAL